MVLTHLSFLLAYVPLPLHTLSRVAFHVSRVLRFITSRECTEYDCIKYTVIFKGSIFNLLV